MNENQPSRGQDYDGAIGPATLAPFLKETVPANLPFAAVCQAAAETAAFLTSIFADPHEADALRLGLTVMMPRLETWWAALEEARLAGDQIKMAREATALSPNDRATVEEALRAIDALEQDVRFTRKYLELLRDGEPLEQMREEAIEQAVAAGELIRRLAGAAWDNVSAELK